MSLLAADLSAKPSSVESVVFLLQVYCNNLQWKRLIITCRLYLKITRKRKRAKFLEKRKRGKKKYIVFIFISAKIIFKKYVLFNEQEYVRIVTEILEYFYGSYDILKLDTWKHGAISLKFDCCSSYTFSVILCFLSVLYIDCFSSFWNQTFNPKPDLKILKDGNFEIGFICLKVGINNLVNYNCKIFNSFKKMICVENSINYVTGFKNQRKL